MCWSFTGVLVLSDISYVCSVLIYWKLPADCEDVASNCYTHRAKEITGNICLIKYKPNRTKIPMLVFVLLRLPNAFDSFRTLLLLFHRTMQVSKACRGPDQPSIWSAMCNVQQRERYNRHSCVYGKIVLTPHIHCNLSIGKQVLMSIVLGVQIHYSRNVLLGKSLRNYTLDAKYTQL